MPNPLPVDHCGLNGDRCPSAPRSEPFSPERKESPRMLLLETRSEACGDRTGRGALSSRTSGTPSACTWARYRAGSFPAQHQPRLEPLRQGPPLALLHPRQSPLGKGPPRPHSTPGSILPGPSTSPRSPAAGRTTGATASSSAAAQRKPSPPPSLNTSGTEKSASGTGRRSDPRGSAASEEHLRSWTNYQLMCGLSCASTPA